MSNATHNALLTTTAVVFAAYAVALLVVPTQLWAVFGMDADASGIWVSRYAGAIALGVAALAFFARRIESMESRRALDGGFLVATSGGLVIGLWAQYVQAFNALGWINVATAAAMAVAYFWFLAGEDRADLASAKPT